MALDPNGKLIEEQTSSGRPFIAADKETNSERSIFVDDKGNKYHLDAKIKDSFSGNVPTVKNFSEKMKGVCLSNDGSSPLTLIINSISITVEVGEVFEGRYDPFNRLEIQGSSAFRGYVTD